MSLLSRALRTRVAFSVTHTLVITRTPSLIHLQPNCRPPCVLNSSAKYPHRLLRTTCSSPFCHSTNSFASLAVPSRPLRFDKVPDRLPDWWHDDDDDDNDEGDRNSGDHINEGDYAYDNGSLSKGGGRGSGRGGNGGGRGDGDWDDDMEKGLFATILAMYTHAIHKAPIRTKAISTCLLALLGDFLAQRIAHREETFLWDRRRSASVGIWGLCFLGPALHSWYGMLDRLFIGRFSVWKKLICDQLLFAPFANGSFIAGVGSLEGMSPKEVMATLKSKLWPSMKANWTLWPAAQFVNFAFVPKTFQIVYVNCVALVWNTILTFISHDHNEEEMPQGN